MIDATVKDAFGLLTRTQGCEIGQWSFVYWGV